jgi:hypothetical protein
MTPIDPLRATDIVWTIAIAKDGKCFRRREANRDGECFRHGAS